jgi:hypothetical protein
MLIAPVVRSITRVRPAEEERPLNEIQRMNSFIALSNMAGEAQADDLENRFSQMDG